MNQKIAIKTDHHFDQTDRGRFSESSFSPAGEIESKLMKLWNIGNFWEKSNVSCMMLL